MLDVASDEGRVIIAKKEVTIKELANDDKFDLFFKIEKTEKVEFRIHVTGITALKLDYERVLTKYSQSTVCLRNEELEFSEEIFSKRGNGQTDYHAFFKRFKWAYGILKYYLPNMSGNVLDIGCGTGNSVIAALLLGAHNVVGIDIDFDVFGHEFDINEFPDICARYGANPSKAIMIEADIFQTKICNEYFDHVLMIDSLEHLPSPGRFIQYAFDVIKPGGCLLIETAPLFYSKTGAHLWGALPDLEPWGHLIPNFDDKVKNLGVDDWHLDKYFGLNRITYGEIIALIKQSGFLIDYEREQIISEEDKKLFQSIRERLDIGTHNPKIVFEESILVRAKKPN